MPPVEQLWPPEMEIARHRRGGKLVNRHDALLRALSEQFHLRVLEVHVGDQQSRRFGDTGTACIEQLEQRLIPHVRKRLLARIAGQILCAVNREDLRHVGRLDGVRQVLRLFGPLHDACRILGNRTRCAHPAEVTAQRAQFAIDRRSRVLRPIELAEIEPQLPMGRLQGVHIVAIGPPEEIEDVVAVGPQRIGRNVSFDPHGFQIRFGERRSGTVGSLSHRFAPSP